MANFITIFRLLFVFAAIALLFAKDSLTLSITAFIFTVIAFIMDGLDGYIARKFNEASKLGSVLDIMSDRIAEYSYWIAFAVLGWIPIAFPLIALTRGVVTDSLRSVALQQGMTAFGSESMQEDPVGRFICASKFMRITYAVMKVLAFTFFILAYAPLPFEFKYISLIIASISAEVAIILCVLRGLPVVFESKKLFKESKNDAG